MKTEYLLFDFIVFCGPLLGGTLKRYKFLKQWKFFVPAILIPAAPYLIWDSLVTGKHWWFNLNYTLPFRIARLPIEECLFFLSVPLACLFVWEVVNVHFLKSVKKLLGFSYAVLFLLIPAGMALFMTGRQYTGMACVALGGTGILDRIMGQDHFLQTRFYYFLLWVILFIFVFNGFLTWRPVVLYDPSFQLDWRIGTIPIEDFGYGLSLMIYNVIIYEYFKFRKKYSSKLLSGGAHV